MAAEKKAKEFQWESKSGETITLPSLEELDPDLAATERIAEATQGGNSLVTIGFHVKFLRSGLPAKYHAELDKLKASEFEAFMAAWAEFSGVEAGE